MAVVATCCWCGNPLKQVRVWRADAWACKTEACFNRQWAGRLSYRKASDRAKDGMGVERLMWLPLPKQVEVLEAVYQKGTPRILFGGARGGGKSHLLRMLHYQRCLSMENFHSLILRRKFPELEQTHILRARREADLLGGRFKETTRTIEWHNGSITRFGHCQTDDDAENYLSAEYDLISFDELVTFPFTMAMRIISSLRSAGRENYVPQVVSGTNPGGPEAWWVKAQYIDQEMDPEEYPDYDKRDYAFIPSKLEDNPYLDKEYEKTLLALPPMLRKAYRDGSWDIWPGQYFPEWDRRIHVVERSSWTPRGTRVYCGIDWGYIRPGCCLWIAVEPEGHAYVFDEFVFKQTITSDVAKEIKRRSKEWGVKPFYVADTQMWGGQDQTGEDMRETFARHGVALQQAHKDRINGWQRVRAWLAPSPDGRPWLQVHPRCPYLIRTLPSLQQDETNPEIVDSDGDDHACLVGSTTVICRDGVRFISDVHWPDEVLTRDGWKRVQDKAMTGRKATVVVRTRNGRRIVGTPDHRIWSGKAWIRLDRLRYCDTIPVWNTSPLRNALPTEVPGPSGVGYADLSRLDTTFTTATAIHSTTQWTIWNASPAENTREGTPDRPRRQSMWRTLWRRLASGIKTPRTATSTFASPSRLGTALPSLSGVRIAEQSTPRSSIVRRHGSVVAGAKLPPDTTLGPTTKLGRVLSAVASLRPTDTRTPRHVLAAAVDYVEHVSMGLSEDVYNLTVEGTHEYLLGNGVLSKNCDALRYAVMARPAPGQTSANKIFPVGSMGWLLNRESRKPKGLLDRRSA